MRKKNGKKTLRMKNGKKKNGRTIASTFSAKILSLVNIFGRFFATSWKTKSHIECENANRLIRLFSR